MWIVTPCIPRGHAYDDTLVAVHLKWSKSNVGQVRQFGCAWSVSKSRVRRNRYTAHCVKPQIRYVVWTASDYKLENVMVGKYGEY